MYLKVDLHECMPSNYEAPWQITSALSAAVLFFFGHSGILGSTVPVYLYLYLYLTPST